VRAAQAGVGEDHRRQLAALSSRHRAPCAVGSACRPRKRSQPRE
jgi:hypothetical protein